MENLTNRETASIVWSVLLLAWCLSRHDVRLAMMNLLKAALNKFIVYAVSYAAICVLLIVLFLWSAGLWRIDQSKDTFLWFVSVALVALFRLGSSQEPLAVFRNWIMDNLKIAVVIEFITTKFSFSLIGEFFLIPTLTLLGVLSVVAAIKKEHATIHTLINGVLAAFALFIVGYAIYQISLNFEDFATVETAIEFITPPLMSVLLLPFLWGFFTYITYERILIRLKIAMGENDSLYSYAKCQAIYKFGLDLEFLERWSRRIVSQNPRTVDEIDQLTLEVRRTKKREACPPLIAEEDGWYPYIAQNFLSEYGLPTNDYRPWGDEWHAEANGLDIEDELSLNRLGYRVIGDELAVKTIELKLTVIYPKSSQIAEGRFAEMARCLMFEVFKEKVREDGNIDINLRENGPEVCIYGRGLSIKRQDWVHSKAKGRYEKKLIIRHRIT